MNWRTPLARAVYRVGGWLIHVKTWQSTYVMHWEDEDEEPSFVEVGRSWETIGWAWDLLELSERLDPRHWEHWALDHDMHDAADCRECGGRTCLECET